MARANNGGWDFVKVGEVYQYKEDWFIAMVTILEDNSDDKYYSFKVRVEKSNMAPSSQSGEFEVCFVKDLDGVFSGMSQLYEEEAYMCEYKWEREIAEK